MLKKWIEEYYHFFKKIYVLIFTFQWLAATVVSADWTAGLVPERYHLPLQKRLQQSRVWLSVKRVINIRLAVGAVRADKSDARHAEAG